MSRKFISQRNLQFLIYEVLDVESLTTHSFFADHNRAVFDQVLETAMKIGRDLLLPVFAEMDRKPPVFEAGEVKVHPVIGKLMKECGEGGWVSAHAPYDQGGQQIPGTVMAAFRCILAAANYSAAVYPFLNSGAAHLISTFGSQALIDTYVQKLHSCQWQGTMSLTEPQAGSSLTDVATSAVATEQGYYKIKGQKIFTSCAEHDCVENVVNLLLARLQGAPPGIKGISLFVVPKKRPENGALVPNDVACTTIFHKLGYRGAPITQLSLGEHGDCRGWLVGEPHHGLRYMFQMMNEARIDVGMSAAAIASAAYYASLEYAKERPQGRKITEKNPSSPQIPIVNHADVKRMLLFQRAVVEGALALNLQCARYMDQIQVLDGDEKEKMELLVDLLTPVAKTYPSEMGILSVSQGLQILGGYGYCEEFPLEQYYRDVRIHTIHEGTTGIQGMDLLGRKVVMKQGKALLMFSDEVAGSIANAKTVKDLVPQAIALEEALEKLKQVTIRLTAFAMNGEIELFLSDATLYLEMFGVVTIAWQWLLQAVAASKALADSGSKTDDFYLGKLNVFRFFFAYELPKIEGLEKMLMNAAGLALMTKNEWLDQPVA